MVVVHKRNDGPTNRLVAVVTSIKQSHASNICIQNSVAHTKKFCVCRESNREANIDDCCCVTAGKAMFPQNILKDAGAFSSRQGMASFHSRYFLPRSSFISLYCCIHTIEHP